MNSASCATYLIYIGRRGKGKVRCLWRKKRSKKPYRWISILLNFCEECQGVGDLSLKVVILVKQHLFEEFQTPLLVHVGRGLLLKKLGTEPQNGAKVPPPHLLLIPP